MSRADLAVLSEAAAPQGAPEAAPENAPEAARAPETAPALTLGAPEPGTTVHVVAAADTTYLLAFAPAGVTLSAEDGALVLNFPPASPPGNPEQDGEGGRIVFAAIEQLAARDAAPTLQIAGTEVSAARLYGQALLLSGEAPDTALETAAAEAVQGGGVFAYSDDLGSVLELLAAQGVIPPTELSFRLIELEDRFHLPLEGENGSLVVNEIGLGVDMGLTLMLANGIVQIEGPMNYVEFFNGTASPFTAEDLVVEFLNPAGVVVTLALPDGLTVPQGGFLVLYQFAGAGAPNSDVYGQVFNAAGAAVGAFHLPGETFWDLGASTAEALAVNLVAGGGSLDTFAANLELADLAVLTDPQWLPAGVTPAGFDLLFETFNGSTSPLQTIFSRVYGDSDTAADWTTNGTATDGALNDVDGGVAPGPQDANPGDAWHDDLDPQQMNGHPMAGQNVLQAGDGGELLEGFGGPDFLFGGDGNDTLYGGSAAEVAAQAALIGGAAGSLPDEGFADHNDFLAGGAGDDALYGGAGADTLYGGLGRDSIDGGSGDDLIYGDDAPAPGPVQGEGDVLAGDGLNNMVDIGAGAFAQVNLGGDDTIFGWAGDDIMAGEALAYSETGAAQALARNDDQPGSADPDGNDSISGGMGNDLAAGEALAWGGAGPALAAVLNSAGHGGSVGGDSLAGGAGHDTLAGEAVAVAAAGAAALAYASNVSGGGAAGNDGVFGGSGDDLLAGEAIAIGGDGSEVEVINEVLAGAVGAVAVGSDTLHGGSGNDTIAGDALAVGGTARVENLAAAGVLAAVGSDSIQGGGGDDLISGGALALGGDASSVNSNLVEAAGNDIILGGDGNDTIAGDALAVDGIAGVENGGDDTLYGGDGDDLISGDALFLGIGNAQVVGGGDDLIYGGAGNDTIYGDSNGIDVDGGDDTLFGEDGDDLIFGNGGDDLIDGGAGDDTLDGGTGNDTLFGGEGDDWLSGGLGDDWLSGGLGDDFLFGGEGDDFLFGGSGDDTLVGGSGNDTLVGGLGADTFRFTPGNLGDTDSVTDFTMAEGDLLDLGDLLFGVGANDGATLDDYLQISFDGVHSTIAVDMNGDGSGFTDHSIVIEGQDLTALGATQADILQALIDGGNLTGL
jgi:Ca2+-binding RTX toxin-like protein